MENIIIINIGLLILNVLCVFWMYKEKSYKIAIFNGFAAGFILCNIIGYFIDQIN